jgi:transcriptional regulator of acetoin/glycerol metabolism
MARQDQETRAEIPTLEEVERRHIVYVLDQTGFNLSLSARILGIDRTTLYNKLKRYGLKRESAQAVGAAAAQP